jgi:cupin 2 domain-containing protein
VVLRFFSINSNSVISGESYQQEQDEWILLLEGEAILEVQGVTQLLKTGDYLFISAQTVHRVFFYRSKNSMACDSYLLTSKLINS